jgi:hypothetical protein
LGLTQQFQNCAKKNIGSSGFDYNETTGIWVPYQFIYADGSTSNGPFTSGTIFGVYAESVQLNDDHTFIPVIWQDRNNYTLKQDEKGTFNYNSATKELIFDNIFHTVFSLTRFEKDELWLSASGILHKFRRQ